MRALALPAAALALLIAGCGGGGSSSTPAPQGQDQTPNGPAQIPAPPAGQFAVDKCLNQEVRSGVTVANLVVPDTLQLDLSRPSTFPNGRQLTDEVIDITLAIIFLDLTKHDANTLVRARVNPGNDSTFRSEFPYLGVANGNPPLPPAGGTNFNFRTDAPSAYVRVDRMGMPAVATALISSSYKSAYNDDNPSSDLTAKSVPDINATLSTLATALADDFTGLGLAICATRP